MFEDLCSHALRLGLTPRIFFFVELSQAFQYG